MKAFLKIYVGCLVLVEIFLFLGGFMLLDFSNGRVYRAGAAVALVLAVAVSMWSSTEHRVAALEKELEALKKQMQIEHSESEDTIS